MGVKVFFIGNVLAGDDGIGPFLFTELKDHPKLADFELMEMGVIGFDLISYIEESDHVIIVDAVHSKKDFGSVLILDENDLSKDLSVVSQHDFGVEQTATVLRTYMPNLKTISIVGILVGNAGAVTNKLSPDLIKDISRIKDEVVASILKIADS